MARMKQATRENNSGVGNQLRSEQRSNQSRAGRGQTIIESPESDRNSCHCRLGHRDFDACSRDPQSPYFHRGLGTPTPPSSSRSSNMKDKAPKKQKTNGAGGGRKRRIEAVEEEEVKYQCDCGQGHDTELECEYAVELKKHVEISTSVIIGSQAMITIHVGTETKQTFLVHKELLALHSGYFHDCFASHIIKQEVKQEVKQEIKSEPNTSKPHGNLYDADSDSEMEDVLRDGHAISQTSVRSQTTNPVLRLRLPPTTIIAESSASGAARELSDAKKTPTPTLTTSLLSPTKTSESYDLPTINPSQFAQFVSFLYAGTVIDAFDPLIMTIEHNSVEALWYVGQALRSPSFQNNILEGLRTTASVKSGTWPSPEDVEIIYDLHVKSEAGIKLEVSTVSEENKLKKFAIHCLGANNPLTRYDMESTEGKAWDEFLTQKRTDIAMELLRVSGRRAFTKPWEDKLRGEYMVEEEGVEERWERMILARRGRAGVREAAKGGDVGAQLEEGHLVSESRKLGYDRWGDSDSDES
ncbi:uncharacterized protein PAC_14589 [Phialocephala subalpina]|uniref:BTB domain-containing protein n=1 Tax=Phialocephala subalpina TaxID=576137 RepID=A0A1L7XI25_9HELO|nr:uncharacterized protein PAC_14589 [Phialocephala subalpina]